MDDKEDDVEGERIDEDEEEVDDRLCKSIYGLTLLKFVRICRNMERKFDNVVRCIFVKGTVDILKVCMLFT